jgi:hypothetical protein
LVLENIQTNGPITVDIAMIDSRSEVDLWGFEGVVGGEMDIEKEDTAYLLIASE